MDVEVVGVGGSEMHGGLLSRGSMEEEDVWWVGGHHLVSSDLGEHTPLPPSEFTWGEVAVFAREIVVSIRENRRNDLFAVHYGFDGWAVGCGDRQLDGLSVTIPRPKRTRTFDFVFRNHDTTWWTKAEDGRDFEVLLEDREGSWLDVRVSVTTMSGIESMLSLHRMKPFWMVPSILHSWSELKHETQFVLCQLRDARLLLIIPAVDSASGVRAVMGPRPCSSNNEGFRLEVLGAPYKNRSTLCMLSRSEPDENLYSFLPRSMKILKAKLQGTDLCLLQDREQPPLKITQRLGWCSWDAFDTSISLSAVQETLHHFRDQCGLLPSFIILDDGWQDGGEAWESPQQELKPVLKSFVANRKFGSHFADSIRSLKEEFDLSEVLVWHTIVGYWGGIAQALGDQAGVRIHQDVPGCFPPGLVLANPIEIRTYWEKIYQIIDPSDAHRFFDLYYENLRACGIDGVKVDGQALLEGMANQVAGGDRIRLARLYREAVSAAAAKHFPCDAAGFAPSLINCMSCSNDHLFLADSASTIWRVSDDHAFPGVEEDAATVARHIWHCAAVSTWLAEFFPVLDWDMFRTDAWHSYIHACARVIGGSPLVVSDGPGANTNTELLHSLLLSDQKTYMRALGRGRPTEDCVFLDPTVTLRIYKIWNANKVPWLAFAHMVSLMYHLTHCRGLCFSVISSYAPSTFAHFARMVHPRFEGWLEVTISLHAPLHRILSGSQLQGSLLYSPWTLNSTTLTVAC